MRFATSLTLLLLLVAAPASRADVEPLYFASGELTLYGELHLPASGDALPGIALIQGSGASGTGNRWARQFAERLAGLGYAVLLPDKRGVGRSEGDWRTAGFEELADDAVASLRAVESHPRVAAGSVGFMGLSQGGHIAPLAGRRVSGIPFVINAVGSLVVMEQQLYHELRNAYLERDLGEQTIDYLQKFARLSFAYLRDPLRWDDYLAMRSEIAAGPLAPAVETWPDKRSDTYWTRWQKIYDYDPLPHWRELAIERRVPSLVLFGANDEFENVPVAASLERAAPLEVDGTLTVRVYEGSGHGLFDPGTRQLRDDMLQDVDAFIRGAIERH